MTEETIKLRIFDRQFGKHLNDGKKFTHLLDVKNAMLDALNVDPRIHSLLPQEDLIQKLMDTCSFELHTESDRIITNLEDEKAVHLMSVLRLMNEKLDQDGQINFPFFQDTVAKIFPGIDKVKVGALMVSESSLQDLQEKILKLTK